MSKLILRIYYLLILLPSYFLVAPSLVLADFTFTVDKTNITYDQEITAQVSLSVQGKANTFYYLQGAFKKEGGNNYFGLTQNNNTWISYSSGGSSTLPMITTDSLSSWTGILKVKIDPNSLYFTGDGNYLLYLNRYTLTGSTPTQSTNFVTISLSGSSPTPTPTSTPGPSPTPTPISSNSSSSAFIISSIPTSISVDSSFPVKIVMTNFDNNTKYYLKGAFIKSGSSNYFGKTLAGSSWVSNSQTYSSQLAITTDSSGNWSGDLNVQPPSDDSGFTGSDSYIFKVGRYTAAGSGPSWSNEISLNITGSSATAAPASKIVTIANAINPNTSKSSIVSSSTTPKSVTPSFSLPNLNTGTVSGVATESSKTLIKPIVKSNKTINPIFFLGGTIFLLISLGSLVIFFTKH